ncbi:Gfo/Idh/MocA family protein [Thermodesulfobacteriota bacterium]
MKKILTPEMIFKAVHNRFTLKVNRGPIGIGLIGIGGWGATNSANIMRCRRFNICGVYDTSTQSTYKFAKRFRTKCYPRMEELLKDSGIQAVAVTVPNQFHEEVVKAAADAGKHIFIEKPLASYPEICRELGHYCQEKGVILQVGHQMYRDPVFGELKRILDEGVLGQPLFAQAVYTLDRRSRDDWRQDADACPGGSMEQLGVHFIDLLIYLFGQPIYTQGWAKNIPRISDEPDWASVSVSFNNNVHAIISTSFSSPSHCRFEVFFDRGHFTTDGEAIRISFVGSKPRKIKPRGLAGGVVQFIDFADCIAFGKKPESGATQAAAVMDVVRSTFSDKGV